MKTAADYPVLAKIGPDNPFFPIIEEAYRVFDCPKPSSTEVCTFCCMDEAIERDLFNPPIARMPLAYVQDWYFAAYDPPSIAKPTWAYLLPRILEVLASGNDVANVGLEVALQRFDTGNRDNWRPEQWNVLDAFQRLYLRLQLERAAPFTEQGDYLDDVVCMFALGGWPVEDLVDQLTVADDRALAERLYRDWRHGRYEDGKIWITAFWEGPGRDEVWSFYTSQGLHDRMARLALDDDVDPELAEKAYRVANVVRANQDLPD